MQQRNKQAATHRVRSTVSFGSKVPQYTRLNATAPDAPGHRKRSVRQRLKSAEVGHGVLRLEPEHRAFLTDLRNDLFCLAAAQIEQWGYMKRIEEVHTMHRTDIQRKVGKDILRRQFMNLPFKKALAAIANATNEALTQLREHHQGDHDEDGSKLSDGAPSFYNVNDKQMYMDEEHQDNISQMAVIFADVTTDEFIEVVMQEEAEDVTTRFGFVRPGVVLVRSGCSFAPCGASKPQQIHKNR